MVVGLQADLLEFLEDPSGDPFIPTGAQGGGRAGRISDLGIRGTEDQDVDEFSEALSARSLSRSWQLRTIISYC